MIDKIVIERNKAIDSAVIMEIQKIAVENGIETRYILNEKAILNALEKQRLKKPYDIEDEWGDYTLSCPTCKNPVIFSSRKFKPPHCIMCGQKFDWNTEGVNQWQHLTK